MKTNISDIVIIGIFTYYLHTILVSLIVLYLSSLHDGGNIEKEQLSSSIM